tara:strand:- start:3929 stop:5521 length:1593 start_codon:yes stop_codon:yes gene_type:complete
LKTYLLKLNQKKNNLILLYKMNSAQAIANLMDYSVNDTPNQIEIRTDTLEPIQSSVRKFTFRLDQAGYLDLNSMLVFKLRALDNENIMRVNAFNGALGGIKRCILQVGDNILNDVQDVNKYATLTKLNVPPTQRNKFFGHYLGNQLHSVVPQTSTDAGEDNDGALILRDLGSVGDIMVDPFKSGIRMGTATDGTGARINSQPIGGVVDNNHQYGITLGMLFPALKGQKIPLFLFDKQRILLTIEFNQPEDYIYSIIAGQINYNAGGANLAPTNADIAIEECRLIVDYIIMGSEIQNEVLQQTNKQGGYRMEFYDVVNVVKGIPAGTTGQQQNIEHRIGQNGREVHNIYQWKQYSDSVDYGCSFGAMVADNISASALLRNQQAIGVEDEEYNVEVNGREEYQDFIYNPVSQYNELKYCLGRPLYVDRPFYCNDQNTTGSLLSIMNQGISGTFKPLGCSLRNGEPALVGGGRQIGNYPIVFKYRYTPRSQANKAGLNALSSGGGFVVNYFCEVSRIANIKNTGNGMSVIVTY